MSHKFGKYLKNIGVSKLLFLMWLFWVNTEAKIQLWNEIFLTSKKEFRQKS